MRRCGPDPLPQTVDLYLLPDNKMNSYLRYRLVLKFQHLPKFLLLSFPQKFSQSADYKVPSEMSTSNPQSRDETVRTRIETRSFTTNSASLPSARQQKEFLPSIQTGIEIPTSTKISTSELSSSLGSLSKERRLQSSQISTSEFSSSTGSSTRENRIPSSQTSTSEFSSSFGSLTGENRLPSSQTSDFTVIRVQERLPGQTPLDQTSNKSTFRRTTSDRNTISSSDRALLPSSPTFLASSKSQSILPTRSLVRLSFSVFRIPRQEGMTRLFILFGLIFYHTSREDNLDSSSRRTL